jgi:hypothetical protein
MTVIFYYKFIYFNWYLFFIIKILFFQDVLVFSEGFSFFKVFIPNIYAILKDMKVNLLKIKVN